ncbi:hypothetical protein PV10_03640 [Exophiala mesophila]|uniref:HD domain-containing protein n=1 Tax=Exophiala mesophila TaxID=212818 RepID=A0A0D2AAX8_EXOME|nr:uncharacterized protein PV10_03640 [Exophiala mesophila]KIV96058.1 hypothetical protein PV10_03640 [Exophiala mesophila]
MSGTSPFPNLPISQALIPTTPLTLQAYSYINQHTSEATRHHVLRSASFAMLLARKFPPLATANLDVEAVALSAILHDMGWATTKSLLSSDKRFEVDGANIARTFIQSSAQDPWDKHRLQLVWDAIALHTTASIAHHKEPEVLATQLGIMADFFGPNLPIPGNLITVEEYKEIVHAFPRSNFKNELIHIMCGLCRDKPQTTFDNFVSDFGVIYGLDGHGTGKEDFLKSVQDSNISKLLVGGLEACAEHEL